MEVQEEEEVVCYGDNTRLYAADEFFLKASVKLEAREKINILMYEGSLEDRKSVV